MITGKNLGYAGGAEVEQVELGKELCVQGNDVCFVTYYCGREQIENLYGIKIIKTYDRERAYGISSLLKFKSIWNALETAKADIYFHEAGSVGVLPIFCRVRGKKFVYRIASDAVVLSKPLNGGSSFSKNLVTAVEIKTADTVIVQSEFQQRILKERFGLSSVIIKNGLALPDVDSEKPMPPVVLWVGSLSKVKKPELFIELAKSVPYAHFEMVGGQGSPTQLYDIIDAAAKQLDNLKFHGFVPFNKIKEYFRRASIFVNTSSIEGFPNTFIQAWMHHIPVVSLNVDPDDVIRNKKLGFCSGTFKQLVLDVTHLLNDKKLRKNMGENGRSYVEREHDIKKTVAKYCAIFEDLLC